MRGKVRHVAGRLAGLGITPAYAGKSRTRELVDVVHRDHPRVCGEKQCLERSPRTDLGSPPRMRGKVQPYMPEVFHDGITPAYAGKRPRGHHQCHQLWDHPRVCGEKLLVRVDDVVRVGSPPRMRGKGKILPGELRALGITPAYAGKRKSSETAGATGEDHPRVCGEKTKKIP